MQLQIQMIKLRNFLSTHEQNHTLQWWHENLLFYFLVLVQDGTFIVMALLTWIGQGSILPLKGNIINQHTHTHLHYK